MSIKGCPDCGAALPPNAPQGLCPLCLAKVGLDAIAAAETSPSDIQLGRTGAMIGRYKLLQKIGEGGFGTVFMAEQTEPIQRRVALKIIKAGMDTKEDIARFEAERQAIDLMDHPNIARALDAGATEAGRPYFVMELVHGIPVTDYCDQSRLPTRERLQLFIKVCQAVQHAHQKGVIHRDLKPSNVLVTLHDGEAVPKVIDFGVAKALGQRLTEKTLFTAFHHLIGTPAYMSPEQAALSGLDIDTRADIYSLGVLLYELLTGVTPFDGETFRKAGLDEMRRTIREVEPVKPSTRLKQERRATHATVGKFALPTPHSALDRDLDWIVMKCLEKDRKRRYETANGLAADVGRHLDTEPIVARPPSNLYRLQKLVRRHKLIFGAGAAVFAALFFGLGFSTWAFTREVAARKRADEAVVTAVAEAERAAVEEARAQMQAERSTHIARYLQSILDDLAPGLAKGCNKKIALSVLAKMDERVGIELRNQPDLEAMVRVSLAEVQKGMGEFAGAETNLNLAMDLRKKRFGALSPEYAYTHATMAELFRAQKMWTETEVVLRSATDKWSHLSHNQPTNVDFRFQLIQSEEALGQVFEQSGKPDAALRCLQEAVGFAKNAAEDFPDNQDLLLRQASIHRALGDLRLRSSSFAEAELNYRTALSTYAALKERYSTNVLCFAEEASCSWNLANILKSNGRSEAALAEYQRTVDLYQRAAARFPGNAGLGWQRKLVRAELAELLSLQGKHPDAKALLEAETQYSLAADFSKDRNPNDAWTYGSVRSDGTFVPFSACSTVFGTELVEWHVPDGSAGRSLIPNVIFNPLSEPIAVSDTVWLPRQTTFHPSDRGESGAVRWTSPHTATYNVAAAFEGRSSFVTTGVEIVQGDRMLFRGKVLGIGEESRVVFGTNVFVKTGGIIEFRVNCWESGCASDTTQICVVITAVDGD